MALTSQSSAPISILRQPKLWFRALWRFSRPHTIIGTSLSVIGLWLIARSFVGIPAIGSTIALLLSAWLACICGNIYIVGLNQIADVEIDRINKPHLPVASGQFSRRTAIAIISITGTLALLIALSQGIFLFATVGSSLVIGTAYSLPPIRLKRFAFWASVCILSVRGGIVNLGLYLHYQQRFLGAAWAEAQPIVIPAAVWVLTVFVVVFSIAIAIFKDIPDIEGDRRFNIQTFTVQMGQVAVFNLARWILTICYLGIILAGILLPSVNAPLLIISHSTALVLCWIYSWRVNWQNRKLKAIPKLAAKPLTYPQFYQFIWKLFFIEYLIFPAACLLG